MVFGIFKKVALIIGSVAVGVCSACNILSLSGGGSHGAFQGGVIQNLVESGKKWDTVTGVSAGGLNTGFLALFPQDAWKDLVAGKMRETWSNINNDNLLHFAFDDTSIYSHAPVRNIIEGVFNSSSGRVNIPAFVGVTDLITGNFNKITLTSENIIDAMLATSSIPVVFPPVKLGNIIAVDGGVESNEILSMKCLGDGGIHMDLIMCHPPDSIVEKNWDLFSILSRSINIIYSNFNNIVMKGFVDCKESKNTVSVYTPKPGSVPWGSLDFNHGAEMWQIGYTSFVKNNYYLC